jgi:predicted TIM-barrel fold metal-dependent hydrolase
MQIVDAQIHVWGSGLPSNLAHRQVTAFPTEEAVGLMDEGGVDAAVIHPPGWDPGATAMAFAAVRTYPGRFAIMGWNQVNWRKGEMIGRAFQYLKCPVHL